MTHKPGDPSTYRAVTCSVCGAHRSSENFAIHVTQSHGELPPGLAQEVLARARRASVGA